MPQEQKVEQQDKSHAVKPVAKVISTSEDGDLFNLGKNKSNASPFITTSIDEPEDMNIPAFMRALKRKRENR